MLEIIFQFDEDLQKYKDVILKYCPQLENGLLELNCLEKYGNGNIQISFKSNRLYINLRGVIYCFFADNIEMLQK